MADFNFVGAQLKETKQVELCNPTADIECVVRIKYQNKRIFLSLKLFIKIKLNIESLSKK